MDLAQAISIAAQQAILFVIQGIAFLAAIMIITLVGISLVAVIIFCVHKLIHLLFPPGACPKQW